MVEYELFFITLSYSYLILRFVDITDITEGNNESCRNWGVENIIKDEKLQCLVSLSNTDKLWAGINYRYLYRCINTACPRHTHIICWSTHDDESKPRQYIATKLVDLSCITYLYSHFSLRKPFDEFKYESYSMTKIYYIT